MLNRIRAALGGGASVDAVLDRAATRPGEVLTGVVHLVGGSVEQQVNGVHVALTVVAEVESGDSEHRQDVVFGRVQVAGPSVLAPGSREQVRFSLPVPLEMPFNVLGGQELRGVRLGVRTDLDLAGALDKGDTDAVQVHALPVHEQLVRAVTRQGFRFVSADLEAGRVPGSSLPVYQELEFRPTGAWSRALNELELTFLTSPAGVEVLLEGDRKGGLFTGGTDRLVRVRVGHDGAGLDAAVEAGLRELGQRRSFF